MPYCLHWKHLICLLKFRFLDTYTHTSWSNYAKPKGMVESQALEKASRVCVLNVLYLGQPEHRLRNLISWPLQRLLALFQNSSCQNSNFFIIQEGCKNRQGSDKKEKKYQLEMDNEAKEQVIVQDYNNITFFIILTPKSWTCSWPLITCVGGNCPAPLLPEWKLLNPEKGNLGSASNMCSRTEPLPSRETEALIHLNSRVSHSLICMNTY